MKKKQKKYVWLLLPVFLLILCFGLVKTNYSKVDTFLKDSFSFLAFPWKQENSVDQTENYLIQKNVNKALLEEIEELKEVLELNQVMTDYQVVNATITSRNLSYWLQTMTIDKGSSSGISKEDLVITKNGLIGRIKFVSKYTSEVELLTASSSRFQLSVQLGNVYGILSSYDAKEKVFLVTGVTDSHNLSVGMEVTTSGLTGTYPKGILIGTIEKIESSSSYEKEIQVKSKQDFNDIKYVSVLKRSKS